MADISAWTEKELQHLADDVRVNLVGNNGATLVDFINAARAKKLNEIGCFEAWIIKHEPKAANYLPDEVVEIISSRCRKRFRSEWIAEDYISSNLWKGVAWLSARLHVSDKCIYHRIYSEGLTIPKITHRPYSPEELDVLNKADLEKITDEEIAAKLIGRTALSVRRARSKLHRLRKELYDWDAHPEAVKYIQENYQEKSYPEIAEHLGLTTYQVSKKARRLGLQRKEPEYDWDAHPRAAQYIIDNYKNLSYSKIARKLKLTTAQVYGKAQRLGLIR
jgi:hypothetical protein